LVYGSIWGIDGRLSFIQSLETCLRCIFPEAPSKEIFPVIGAASGHRLAPGARDDQVSVGHGIDPKDPDCPTCGNSAK
jgi:hypothetical protein